MLTCVFRRNIIFNHRSLALSLQNGKNWYEQYRNRAICSIFHMQIFADYFLYFWRSRIYPGKTWRDESHKFSSQHEQYTVYNMGNLNSKIFGLSQSFQEQYFDLGLKYTNWFSELRFTGRVISKLEPFPSYYLTYKTSRVKMWLNQYPLMKALEELNGSSILEILKDFLGLYRGPR